MARESSPMHGYLMVVDHVSRDAIMAAWAVHLYNVLLYMNLYSAFRAGPVAYLTTPIVTVCAGTYVIGHPPPSPICYICEFWLRILFIGGVLSQRSTQVAGWSNLSQSDSRL